MINNIDLIEFERKLSNKDTFVVDFYADWCQSCIEMMPLIEEISNETDIPFYKVNIDEDAQMKDRNRIKAIPMLIMFKDGRMAEFIYGKVEKIKIQHKLNRLTK